MATEAIGAVVPSPAPSEAPAETPPEGHSTAQAQDDPAVQVCVPSATG